VRITVGNLKGGSSKTTSAEDWPADRCTVVPIASRDLARRVGPVLRDYEHVVFDVGPKNPALLRQAMSLSDVVVIPAQPATADMREVPKTMDLRVVTSTG
jgi:chromosome partitioning protein